MVTAIFKYHNNTDAIQHYSHKVSVLSSKEEYYHHHKIQLHGQVYTITTTTTPLRMEGYRPAGRPALETL